MATTSRALNGLPGVAPATRDLVLRVAREHSYVVSPEASALSGGTTKRIAVVVPHLSRWFFAEMLEGVEGVVRGAGLDLLLYRVGEAEDRSSFFERLPARRKVDGLLVVGFPVTEPEQARLALMDVPVVAAGGQMAAYPHVGIDDHAAGEQAMHHLLNLGHRRIAMIDTIDPNADEWPVDGRALAYHQALEEAGVRPDPELFVRVPWGAEPGAQAMASLLALREPPTAVFAHSDEVAMGALRTIRRAGLSAPDDISVIGVDDHPLASELDLTTIRQEVCRQGELAATLLTEMLSGRPPQGSPLLPTRLVVRGSTGRPHAGTVGR